MRTLTYVGATLVACFSLAGCGLQLATPTATTASPTPTYTAPSPYAWQSACDLLLGVDIPGLLGEDAATPYVSKGGRCQMTAAAKTSTAALELYITSPGGAEQYDYQEQQQVVDHVVNGLGDAAFQSGGYLHVLVGDSMFTLVAIRDPSRTTEPSLDELVAAGRVILGNTDWETTGGAVPSASAS